MLCLFFGALLSLSYLDTIRSVSAVIAGAFCFVCHIDSVIRAIIVWHTLCILLDERLAYRNLGSATGLISK